MSRMRIWTISGLYVSYENMDNIRIRCLVGEYGHNQDYMSRMRIWTILGLYVSYRRWTISGLYVSYEEYGQY